MLEKLSCDLLPEYSAVLSRVNDMHPSIADALRRARNDFRAHIHTDAEAMRRFLCHGDCTECDAAMGCFPGRENARNSIFARTAFEEAPEASEG